jgi:hypothetical protein
MGSISDAKPCPARLVKHRPTDSMPPTNGERSLEALDRIEVLLTHILGELRGLREERRP